jgi:pilus assembly protein CpaD
MNAYKSTPSRGTLRRMFGPLATAGLVAVLLSGCANREHVIVGSIPDDYRTRHPIVINEQEHTFDIPVASGDRKLTQALRESVRGASGSYHRMASGSMRVMVPVGSPNAGAASLVSREIVDILAGDGVPRNRIIVTSYQAPSPQDVAPVRIAFVATTASAGPCGRWPEDMLANSDENRNYQNFGCSSQSNLAAQIENPGDLLAPRGMSPIDAERRATVVDAYQTGGAALASD